MRQHLHVSIQVRALLHYVTYHARLLITTTLTISFFRPLSPNCTGRDYVKIYDGVDEFSPLIGTFCGLGHLPSSIVGTRNQLFLEFHSEPEGAFLSTGFDLRVGHRPGNIHPYSKNKDGDDDVDDDGKCEYTFTSEALEEAGDGQGIFLR